MAEEAIRKAMRHPDRLGAGARKRRKLKTPDKVKTVMKEFARGTLHSGSGQKVTDKSQALAIGYSEQRKRNKS